MKRNLKDIDLFLLDQDGTIYNEETLIHGALEFFHLLQEQGKKYAFMTNNSSKGKSSYVQKLNKLGIYATEDYIVSSVNATVKYLKDQKKGAKLYVVGTTSLIDELTQEGFVVVPDDYRGVDIDFVLVGFDTELNYKKVYGACYYINRGYPYIATNCDLRCPIGDHKFIPDCGAITKMIELATERQPLFLGKPERVIVDSAAEKWDVPVERIACVGDRLYTDIQVGINAGCTTICVYTGETTPDAVKIGSIKPDYCFNSIYDLYLVLRS